MGNQRRKAALIAAVLLTALATLLAVPASGSAGVTASAKPVGTISVTPAAGVPGTAATVAGKVPGQGVRRKLALQVSSGAGWTTVARASSKKGSYTFATALPGVGSYTYRVVAKAVRLPSGKLLPASTTKTAAVLVNAPATPSSTAPPPATPPPTPPSTPPSAPAATLTGPATTYVNKSFELLATFTPAERDRAVLVEQYDAGSWAQVAALEQDGDGRVVAELTVVAPGLLRYRARTAGVGAVTTNEVMVRVDADPVQVSDRVEVLTANEAGSIDLYTPDSGRLVFGTDAPASVGQIAVGDVVPVPPRGGLESGALVEVVGRSSSAAGTTLQTTPVDLPSVVENVPDDATDVAMVPVGDPVVTDVAPGVVIEDQPDSGGPLTSARAAPGAGARTVNVDGIPIGATLSTQLSQTQGGVKQTVSLKGSVSVTPTVEVGLDMDWSTLKRFSVGAGLKVEESVALSYAIGFEHDWEYSLFAIQMTRGGLIGGVPIWVTFEGQVKLVVGVSGEIRSTIEWQRKGIFMAGVQASRGDGFKLHSYQTSASSTARMSKVEAAGKAEGRVLASAQLSLYSLIGPYAEIGFGAAAEITGSSADGLSCDLHAGPIASVGVRTSAALKQFTGLEFTPVKLELDLPQLRVQVCPPRDDAARWLSLEPGVTTCGITDDYAGWCWGSNHYDTVGDGTTEDRETPFKLDGTWRTLRSSRSGYTCGIRLDASLWCWGSRTGATTPKQVAGSWKQLTFGVDGAPCAVRSDDTGWCWTFSGNSGALTQVRGLWRTLSQSSNHGCGVRIDGTGWCWGSNDAGQLGNGTTTDSAVPVRALGTWRSMTTGADATCAIGTDQTGWCWGNGLTAGTGWRNVSIPTQLPGFWKQLAIGPDYQGVATTCGIQVDASRWCWGYNFFPSVGNGETTLIEEPLKLVGSWSALSLRGHGESCALRSSAVAACWGRNDFGGVGDGTTQPRLTPYDLPGRWISVASDDGVTCGIKEDRTGWCWGYFTGSLTPTKVRTG